MVALISLAIIGILTSLQGSLELVFTKADTALKNGS